MLYVSAETLTTQVANDIAGTGDVCNISIKTAEEEENRKCETDTKTDTIPHRRTSET
jgi:hypothetical protein